MSSKLSKTYDPNLTLVKNAELAGVSITAVEKYKKRIGVSHRSVRAEFISNAIRTYLKKYPYAKKKEVAKHIGLSVKTVSKYIKKNHTDNGYFATNKVVISSDYDFSNLPILTLGSICTGIDTGNVAYGHLNIQTIWHSEIDTYACRILDKHYKYIPNVGDMHRISELVKNRDIQAPDIITGATPCNTFSIAGKQQGLNDERGLLTPLFVKICDEIDSVRHHNNLRQSIVFWENVESVITNSSDAFTHFINDLAGTRHNNIWGNAGMIFGTKRNVCWRVLNAKYFGLPQQRRRVFVLATPKDINPANVLFELTHLKPHITVHPTNCLKSNKNNVAIELFRDYSDCLVASYGAKWNGNSSAYSGSQFVIQGSKVRRFTPVECERLMGLPDNYTKIDDTLTNRYKVIGNAWAVPVIKWIFERLRIYLSNPKKYDVMRPYFNPFKKNVYFYAEALKLCDNLYLNTTASKNNPCQSSLLDIIETNEIPQNLYLSPEACQGILRRKDEMDRQMPERLKELLLLQIRN